MAQFDTDKMAQEVAEKAVRDTDFYGKSLTEWIDEMKSGKAVPVVRCKDCKYWDRGNCYRLELSRPDDFCSYGERREEDDSKKM